MATQQHSASEPLAPGSLDLHHRELLRKDHKLLNGCVPLSHQVAGHMYGKDKVGVYCAQPPLPVISAVIQSAQESCGHRSAGGFFFFRSDLTAGGDSAYSSNMAVMVPLSPRWV